MIVKISDVVTAQTGLVLSRKEARDQQAPDGFRYSRLTLRALGEDGFIHQDGIEDFLANEVLSNALFTSEEDIVLRLFSPMYPVCITQNDTDLLVPSQLAVLRVRDKDTVLPEYLRLCLAQKEIQEKVAKIESGTAQRTVKLGTILDLQITIPELEIQRKVMGIDNLSRNRERLYRELLEQERQLTNYIISNIVGGSQK